MEKKPVELLDRLKVVKVTSDDVKDEQKDSRPLPQHRDLYQLPTYGYEEPKSIPEGKCTLKQALQFITNHQNDPSTHTIASIAETHKMKSSDVENIINNFRAYKLYVGRDTKVGMTDQALKSLGITKVQRQLYKAKFANKMENVENRLEEKEKK